MTESWNIFISLSPSDIEVITERETGLRTIDQTAIAPARGGSKWRFCLRGQRERTNSRKRLKKKGTAASATEARASRAEPGH